MEKGDGMSFAEFSYPLLQGWDWWHMYSNHDVQLQVGGSDQYGNIIAGMDAIKHISQINPEILEGKGLLDYNGKLKTEVMPMGITVPLLTTASGEKFGKSAGNAIWLDANLTSPFDLYGFLLRSSDADVARYLSLFTFVPLSTIAETMTAHTADPGKRLAQHLLASEVLELVHGREVAELTRGQHQAMRNPSLSGQSQLQGERTILPRSLVAGTPFTRILWHAGIAGTKSEAARLVKSGGVYVADSVSGSGSESEAQASESKFAPIKNQKPEDLESFTRDGLLVLRTGKWKVRIVEVVDDETFEKSLDGGEAPPGWEEWKSTSAERA
jgi:tyrosyl-tRNA synthetase